MKVFLILIFLLTALFLSPMVQAEDQEFYAEVGPTGLFHIGGSNRDFGAAPGVQMGFGYDWQYVGIRGTMLVVPLEDERPFGGADESVELINTSFVFRFFPLDMLERGMYRFKPYFSMGVGPYFLTEGGVEDNDNAAGIGGVFGAGFRIYANETISFGLDNNFHLLGMLQDTPGMSSEHDLFGLQFYNLSGFINFHFF